MRCPKCEDTELTAKRVHEVEIDECASCRGIWFDEDELRKIKDRTDEDLNWLDFDLWKHEERFRATWQDAPCPRCEQQLVAVEYAETGVVVDVCRSCKGVWLDGGELEGIVAALEEEALQMTPSEYLSAALDEARQVLVGDEGLASDWRDLVGVLRMMKYRIFSGGKVARLLADAARANPIR